VYEVVVSPELLVMVTVNCRLLASATFAPMALIVGVGVVPEIGVAVAPEFGVAVGVAGVLVPIPPVAK
jgi:hypothetical protein